MGCFKVPAFFCREHGKIKVITWSGQPAFRFRLYSGPDEYTARMLIKKL